MPGAKQRVRVHRRWAWSARTCLVLAVFFSLALGVTCFYRWMAGDALEGTSRLDYGVHDGAVWIVYYEKPISWMAVESGGRYDPALPRLWPKFDVGGKPPSGWHTVAIPLWIPAALCGLAFAGFRVVGRRRARKGACPACGYEIGIEGAERCPECGCEVP